MTKREKESNEILSQIYNLVLNPDINTYERTPLLNAKNRLEKNEYFPRVMKDLGFDLSEKLSDGSYKYASSDGDMTISMTSGKCAARDFIITDGGIKKVTTAGVVTYELICNRDQDDDIGMAFPNTTYTIAAGDTFVLINIQMPDVYVYSAMQKLLVAGNEYLNANNKPVFTYEPTIDNIFMANNPLIGYNLKEGDTITFEDLDLPVSNKIIISNLEIKEDEFESAFNLAKKPFFSFSSPTRSRPFLLAFTNWLNPYLSD